jgi:site-specific DNA-methyltransferase (adenine-specific)
MAVKKKIKPKAGRNRSVVLSDRERGRYGSALVRLNQPARMTEVMDRVIRQDVFEALDRLPEGFADLVFADPPYNLSKNFNGRNFSRQPLEDYEGWLETWLGKISRAVKPTGSIYICSDWRGSAAVQRAAARHFIVRNRITWEREKGRGARANWKNAAEDIWFCTAGERFTFNVEAVKLKRRVLAPYTDANRRPKDWQEQDGEKYRLTHPSNLWTDLTVPFWSMPENTDHPTQKPEKLLARIILASSNPGDVVLDPFLGSGTTAVVAKKLGRHYIGIEIDGEYCCLAAKRLAAAVTDKTIQGYRDGVFWERNAKHIENEKGKRKN